ncbi:hypothetical protein [Hymenobacter actinosclerus]|uniref:Uncharacterized protein n=1 Tax=Hymenobacter actinosclerus TaxID=82805 RepID=A0A1H9ZPR9_9BACT|nr:hypothetical protein [Hymenobacter actinosclerus]SES83341.1 hypothetical protein SAMN04487998_0413 [Hymenobacter actinosclerus]
MIERLLAHFPASAACVSTHTERLFYIYDQEGNQPCRHRTAMLAPTDLTVRNASAVAVHLIAIDHCLYNSSDSQRCDCALVRGEEIHFVEFKHGTNKNRASRLKECIPQLAAAINAFIRAGIIAPHSSVRAVACVGFAEQRPPRGAAIEARILQLNLLVPEVIVELFIDDSTEFN